MQRKCEICDTDDKGYLHAQSFVLPDLEKPFEYAVVACNKCGFVFADNVPSQEEYDRYYKSNNKYKYNSKIPSGLIKIYNDMFLEVEDFFNKNIPSIDKNSFKILDIGCSVGYFLNLFKEHGYKSLKGIEPAPDCGLIAKELYGIEVFSGILSEFTENDEFDFVIMSGVLEHISELNKIISEGVSLLKEDGIFMIVVPDAGNFTSTPNVPFDEFSLEHINYFTHRSLSNLMKRHGFKNIFSKSIDADFYDTKALVSLFARSSAEKENFEMDSEGIACIKNYISASNEKIETLNKMFGDLIESGEELAVWGVGSLTFRLLASSNLPKANIRCFIDSNKALQGKKINGIEVLPPDFFVERTDGLMVFISSHSYGKEIRDVLINKYKFRGHISIA